MTYGFEDNKTKTEVYSKTDVDALSEQLNRIDTNNIKVDNTSYNNWDGSAITTNGITITRNNDGYIVIDGQSTDSIYIYMSVAGSPSGIMKFTGCPDGGSANTYYAQLMEQLAPGWLNDTKIYDLEGKILDTYVQRTGREITVYQACFKIMANAVFNNTVVPLQLFSYKNPNNEDEVQILSANRIVELYSFLRDKTYTTADLVEITPGFTTPAIGSQDEEYPLKWAIQSNKALIAGIDDEEGDWGIKDYFVADSDGYFCFHINSGLNASNISGGIFIQFSNGNKVQIFNLAEYTGTINLVRSFFLKKGMKINLSFIISSIASASDANSKLENFSFSWVRIKPVE